MSFNPKIFNFSSRIDYFTLGIKGYEFMNGKRPYRKEQKGNKKKIVEKQTQIKIEDKPLNWSVESVDCIIRLNLCIEI